jgi:hypothetical protein
LRGLAAQLQAGVALDDGECALRIEAGQKLVDGRLAQLGLERELLARNPLPREKVPDLGRNRLLLVHARPPPARLQVGRLGGSGKEQESSGECHGKIRGVNQRQFEV